MRTLCIDIGGSGIKAIVLDEAGAPVTERARLETPDPATPEAVLAAIDELLRSQSAFDRVSVGFPGVVMDGVTRTAPNLGDEWAGFALAATLEERTGRPVRVANDAGIQGLGVIEGRGLEMVITLGTGMGCGLYIDGRYVPNLELAHHPFRKKATYEERVGNAARKRVGDKRWNERVRDVVAQLEPIFNYRRLYIGGGNAKRLGTEGLPANVSVVDNIAGLLGGIRLWADSPASVSPVSAAPEPGPGSLEERGEPAAPSAGDSSASGVSSDPAPVGENGAQGSMLAGGTRHEAAALS